MSVTENRALGSWSLSLRPETPLDVLDRIDWFGHIAITGAREDIRVAGDAVLDSARYVGVLRKVSKGEGKSIGGVGMRFWLGDEDNKGHVLESAVTITAQSFAGTVAALLPPSVLAGTLHSVTGLYTGTHRYQSPRQALDYVMSIFDAEYRVNGNGTVDAGTADQLFGSTPRGAVIRRGSGTAKDLVALPGEAKLDSDVEDFTTRVLLLAASTEETVATGDADIAPGLNPHVDLFGNPVVLTRMVSESATSEGNADARAQLQLNRFSGTRDAVTLNSTTHDVRGTVSYGAPVWCYDLDAGLYDLNNEVQWQGELIHPVKLRVSELTWPVEEGCGVYYRTPGGEWIDLTDHVVFESGQTNITVGGYSRSLVATGAEPVSVRVSTLPTPNTTIPAAPTWVTPFTQTVYLSGGAGMTRAQVELAWTRPANTDATPIADGDHFEIRYRTTSQAILPATHQQMSGYTHAALNTHGQPIPYEVSAWTTIPVAWQDLQFLLAELSPGTPYELQIRAWDNGGNPSVWSASTIVQTAVDTLAPQTPAPPVVAGNRLALMVRHDLGIAEGGTFNLALDLNHLEVHAEYEPLFEPITAPPSEGGTMLGKLAASDGMIVGNIPAIGSFGIENTGDVYVKVVAVDHAGNRSRPSTAVQASAELVDAAHISSIFAETIVSGTVLAALILGGSIATSAGPGARVGFNMDGFYAYDAAENLFFEVNKSAGYMRGNWQLGPDTGPKTTFTTADQTVRFYPLAGSDQRIRVRAYSVDQPEDPTDTPGLEITAFNENLQLAGGTLSLGEDRVTFGIRDDRGTAPGQWTGYHAIDSAGVHRFVGSMPEGSFNSDYMFVNDHLELGAGFTGVVYTWGSVAASPLNPQVTIYDSGGLNPASTDQLTSSLVGIVWQVNRAVRISLFAVRTNT